MLWSWGLKNLQVKLKHLHILHAFYVPLCSIMKGLWFTYSVDMWQSGTFVGCYCMLQLAGEMKSVIHH